MISVVIPAYNAAPYLRAALDSVLAQTLSPLEIIVVNDGSTDDTEEICRSYSGVHCISQRNQGIAAARNAGISAAKGEWIALLDSDDIMLPDRLAVQARLVAENPDLIAVYSGFSFLNTDGSQSLSPAFPAKDLWPAIRYRMPILPSTVLVRRSALLAVGGFHNRITEDWDLFFRLVRKHGSKAFHESAESLVLYRVLPSGWSKNHHKMMAGRLDMLDRLLLVETSGLSRLALKYQIQAKFLHELSVAMREHGEAGYLRTQIKSLTTWPFFGRVVSFQRYKIFAHMALMRLVNRPERVPAAKAESSRLQPDGEGERADSTVGVA